MDYFEKRREAKRDFCKQVTKFFNIKGLGNSLSGGFYITNESLDVLKEQLKGWDLRYLKQYLRSTFTDKQIRKLLPLLGYKLKVRKGKKKRK